MADEENGDAEFEGSDPFTREESGMGLEEGEEGSVEEKVGDHTNPQNRLVLLLWNWVRYKIPKPHVFTDRRERALLGCPPS